jgi:hypothetical protein
METQRLSETSRLIRRNGVYHYWRPVPETPSPGISFAEIARRGLIELQRRKLARLEPESTNAGEIA